MPLFKGKSKEVIGENVREMRNAGHSEAQSVAAAMKTAGHVNPFAKKKGAAKKVAPKAKAPRKMSEIADSMEL